jgi:membrane protein YdbS with pleckstrin-like domain
VTGFARRVLWALAAVTVGVEVWAYVAYRDAIDGVFANVAILVYAAIVALAVWFVDFLYRVIRYPPHRKPPAG